MRWWFVPVATLLFFACSEETRDPTGAPTTFAGPTGPSGGPSGSGGATGSGGGGGGGGSVPPHWDDLAPIAGGPTQENAVVALDGEVFTIGGFDDVADILADVEAYDPATDTWRTAASLPNPRHHANAAVVGGKIYVVGSLAGNGFAAQPDVYVYDPVDDNWDVGQLMPGGTERGGSAVGVIGTKIYIAGGYRQGAVSDFSSYDTTNSNWDALPPVPGNRDHLVGGALGGIMYVICGRAGSISGVTDSVDAFDPSTNTWTSRAAMPTPRAGCMASLLGGRFFVFGGEGNTASPVGIFDNVEAYDPASDTWETFAPMVTPRHGTGAATVGNAIYVPGGATTQAFGAVATHEAFVP